MILPLSLSLCSSSPVDGELLVIFRLLQERIPVEEVFGLLKTSKDGLTAEEGEQRLQIFGPNKLEEKEASLPET